MKTLYIYLICFISAGFSACSLLELEPTTSWSTENTPKEESHLYGILYGGYNTLQSDLSINFLIYGEMRGDAFYNNAFNVNTDKVVNNSLDNNISQASWYNYYRAIKQANVVIKFTPQVLEAGGISTRRNGASLLPACFRLLLDYSYLGRCPFGNGALYGFQR